MKTPLHCPECGKAAILVKGVEVYPNRDDLNHLNFWECPSRLCDARVGCHSHSYTPLGTLATLRLRTARSAAHKAFDKLWRSKTMTRIEAYKWLAKELSIESKDCHVSIAQLDEAQCNEVIRLVNSINLLNRKER